MYGGMLARFGREGRCCPSGQPELLLLKGFFPSGVGIEGKGQQLPPQAGRLDPTLMLTPTGHRTLNEPASLVKPGILPTASNRECLPQAPAWLNQLQCKLGALLVSAMRPICQSTTQDFRVYKKKWSQLFNSNLLCLITQLEWEGSCCL